MLDEVGLICELDEQWAYVGNKNHRHKRKRVVTYTFGPRSDNTCRRLPSLVAGQDLLSLLGCPVSHRLRCDRRCRRLGRY
ncbi:hypothetical protein DBR19_22465 [Aeromonas sp. HMWF014]|nr:hypothetical protein DBR19_22465 [Aeromonas sp. HMWF014]